jgi:hypothetical protein
VLGVGCRLTKCWVLGAAGVYSVFDDTSQLVGCERFNKAYFEMKSAFCCDFVSAAPLFGCLAVDTRECSGDVHTPLDGRAQFDIDPILRCMTTCRC